MANTTSFAIYFIFTTAIPNKTAVRAHIRISRNGSSLIGEIPVFYAVCTSELKTQAEIISTNVIVVLFFTVSFLTPNLISFILQCKVFL